jgi:phospholipid/cholesterol/gamma-HCH transport system permease protein
MHYHPPLPGPADVPVVFDRLLAPFNAFGQYVLLLARAFRSANEFASYRAIWVRQMMIIGVESLPIVLMAAAFSSAVMTLQAGYQLATYFIPSTFIGAMVGPSVILELAAVSSAFVLASRIGARIAAELGSMRVSGQIDALETMGLNAACYLIVPRVLAGVLMFPMLYVAACLVGVGSGILMGDIAGLLSLHDFMYGARQFYDPSDPFFGLTKAVTFGFLITSIACYKGYYATGGAEGVGTSTTESVVQGCLSVLLADLALAVILL